MSKFIEVKDALGIDNERVWYYIPGFNGYEISNDYYIRSMKHWKKYPTGILIKPISTRQSDGLQTFELSNDNNERVRVTPFELMELAKSNNYQYPGYPRKTYQCDMAPRNIHAFIKKKEQPRYNEEANIIPHFSVIKESKTEIICPVYDLSGRGMYYGR
jgi:hypothetical protein